jgi:hypothetical protein
VLSRFRTPSRSAMFPSDKLGFLTDAARVRVVVFAWYDAKERKWQCTFTITNNLDDTLFGKPLFLTTT